MSIKALVVIGESLLTSWSSFLVSQLMLPAIHEIFQCVKIL
uniref:Uncharacterized protein n=1 Tax=Lepeophtheirus salmonis TaxID=72036 RepID=A0A0K2US43_LEPSM